MTPTIVIIDNYDSFTYNLVHLVSSLGAKVDVIANDQYRIEDLHAYQGIILSPGPGIPREAGLLLDTIHHYASSKPILGVCLGHQAIAEVYGGNLINLPKVYHGIKSVVTHQANDFLFKDIPTDFEVGRYHSWVVSPSNFPQELQITARTADGQIMALRHKRLPIYGVQFHPESILTPYGDVLMRNWLSLSK